jgi:hypothetical protein
VLGKESVKLQHLVERLRAQLAETLQSAAQVFPSARSALHELPKLAGLPLPDPSAVAQKLVLRRPAVLVLFGRAALRRHLRTKLRQQVGLELHNFLGLHSRRLAEWAKETLSAIQAAYSTSAEIFRAQCERRQPENTAAGEDRNARLQQDILLLEKWDEQSPATQPISPR